MVSNYLRILLSYPGTIEALPLQKSLQVQAAEDSQIMIEDYKSCLTNLPVPVIMIIPNTKGLSRALFQDHEPMHHRKTD